MRIDPVTKAATVFEYDTRYYTRRGYTYIQTGKKLFPNAQEATNYMNRRNAEIYGSHWTFYFYRGFPCLAPGGFFFFVRKGTRKP